MRTLSAALALVLVACAPSDRGDSTERDARTRPSPGGPDAVVLRVPRAGGRATAYIYPRLDSAVWQSSASLPAVQRVLAFDPEGGALAFVAGDGAPGRLDLRLGTVSRTRNGQLRALDSADGYSIYGVDQQGRVVRLTPTGESWTLTPPAPARLALPQPDGWLLVVADRGDETVVWRLHPPERRLVDSISLPKTSRAVRTNVGDRLYLAADERLLGVRSQGLQPVPSVDFDEPVRALATTPSGDRVYVATDSSRELAVVDRYREDVSRRIRLPGAARDLRMDPLGRYLLVRPVRGDSAWVVSLSSDALVGTVATAWREDLPFVSPDGAVAVVRGPDVVFLQGERLQPGTRVAGGADDMWHTLRWNGFRPRSGELDDPVSFRERVPSRESTPADTQAAAGADSLPAAGDTLAPPAQPGRAAPTRPSPTPAPRPAQPTPPPAPTPAGFYVSFAALLNQERARELANQIEVDGQRARVVEGQQAGTSIYRVLLGPYPARADAERIGRASGRTFFIIEGAP